MKRIAIWNTAFVGDAVLTLPLIQTVAENYPDASIDFYVRGGLSALFSQHPAINAVYEYDKNGKDRGFLACCKMGHVLRERSYDLWISAHPSPRSAALSFLSRAPMRIGYSGAWYSTAYTHTVERCFGKMDEIERLLRLVIPLEVKRVSSWPEMYLPDEAKQKAENFFREFIHAPALGIHPGSVWATKRWPAESFAEVGVKAIQAGAQVILFAGPGEEDMAKIVSQKIQESLPVANSDATTVLSNASSAHGKALLDVSGKLSLPELAAFLSKLDCYLSNDSGPMHLAWAQHTPVTGIFGPTVRSLGFFPRGEKSDVLEVELPCRPCSLHGPKRCPHGHHDCMYRVDPESVWQNVRKKLFRMA